jgi:hypothetical protein
MPYVVTSINENKRGVNINNMTFLFLTASSVSAELISRSISWKISTPNVNNPESIPIGVNSVVAVARVSVNVIVTIPIILYSKIL